MTLPSSRRAVVTGCAGFIGSHLTEKLLAEGWDVVGIDCFDDYYDPRLKHHQIATALAHPRFKLEVVDLADAARARDVADRAGGDVVVHLAGLAGVRLSTTDPARYVRANIVATQNVIDGWSRARSVPLVFGSSSSVYGNDSAAPFVESLPCVSPPSPYAATKRACELLCQTANHLHGVAITVLRFFTVYGPRQRPDLAIRKFSTAILRDKELTVFGDGTMARDFTHVSDIVRGIVAAVEAIAGATAVRDAAAGATLENGAMSIVNLGSSSPISVNDLVDRLATALGKAPKVSRIDRPAGEMNVTFADTSEAARRWRWRPEVVFDEGLRDFAAWLRVEEAAGRNP